MLGNGTKGNVRCTEITHKGPTTEVEETSEKNKC